MITKGMILSAGLGTRLLPITERFPKPLVPVLNIANILHTVSLFKRAGIQDLVINLFHLPQRIEEFFNDLNSSQFRIRFSKEEVLLGTGGGVKKAQKLFGGEAFVLANCDFISNMNIEYLIREHKKAGAWATMALIEDPERQPLYSTVGVTQGNLLCSLPKKKTQDPFRQGIFTGVHVLEPAVFSFLEEKPSGINDVLYPALMEKHPEKALGVFMDSAFWYDTGDLPALWKTTQELLLKLSDPKSFLLDTISGFGPVYKEVLAQVWTTQRTTLPSSLRIEGPALIGEGCSFEEGVEIGPFSVIGEKVVIGRDVRVENSVILPHSKIESGSEIRNSIFFEGNCLAGKP